MGTSALKFYGSHYKGELSDEVCDILESLLDLKEANGVVSDLLHSIYDLPDFVVNAIIDDYDTYGRVTLDYEKPIGTLRDYQTIGVAFMYYAGDCILGDSVGMGKTVETAGLMNIVDLFTSKALGHPHRYLLVTEKKPVLQVRREMIKYTGAYAHLILDATVKRIKMFSEQEPFKDDLQYSVVGTHGLLKASGFISWMEQYNQYHGRPPFDTLVVDESSPLGGVNTGIVKSFKVIRKYFSRVVFLNATPFESRLDILYNQLNLLDSKMMPTKQSFQREYCIMDYTGMYPRPTNRYKNKEQFRDAIALRYYASTRRENGAIMDNCHGDILLSQLSADQKRLMKESQLSQMVCDCPSYIDDSVPFDKVHVPKLGSLERLLANECKDATSIIIYVHFREAQDHLSDWLSDRGYSNRVLNGDTPDKDVDNIIEGFKDGAYSILITNVQKGLNFGNCDYCIFYSIITSPSKMVQFEGRMTRGFDILDKHVYMLCSLGKEFNNLRTLAKDRAEAMQDMTTTDYSVVLELLNRIGNNSKDGR